MCVYIYIYILALNASVDLIELCLIVMMCFDAARLCFDGRSHRVVWCVVLVQLMSDRLKLESNLGQKYTA